MQVYYVLEYTFMHRLKWLPMAFQYCALKSMYWLYYTLKIYSIGEEFADTVMGRAHLHQEIYQS